MQCNVMKMSGEKTDSSALQCPVRTDDKSSAQESVKQLHNFYGDNATVISSAAKCKGLQAAKL